MFVSQQKYEREKELSHTHTHTRPWRARRIVRDYNKSNNHHENAKRNSFLQTLYYFRILSIDASMVRWFYNCNGSIARWFVLSFSHHFVVFSLSWCHFILVIRVHFSLFIFRSLFSHSFHFSFEPFRSIVRCLIFIVLFLITVSFFSQFTMCTELQYDARNLSLSLFLFPPLQMGAYSCRCNRREIIL